MPVFLLNFLFAISAAMAGVAAGWLLRGGTVRRESRSDSSPSDSEENDRQSQARQAEARRSSEVMGRLQDLAARMAADVNAHSSRVQEISDELDASDSQQADDVVNAVAKIIESNQRMQNQLATAEEKLYQQEQQIESHAAEARTDALTLVANRRAFDDEMQRCADQFAQRKTPFTLMMTDVDHFKKFNDKHGHQAGDAVLKDVARVLRTSIGSTDIVARYGGEEFAVIFPNTKLSKARGVADHVRSAISKSLVEFEGVQLRVTASAGLAELEAGEDVEGLIRRADEAMYASKQAGRDCGHWHDGSECRLIVEPDPQEQVESSEIPLQVGDAMQTPSGRTTRLDPLTGLSNRTTFLEDMNRRVAEWKRGGSPLAVMVLQIDHFQRIGDQHGIEAGDMILRTTTQFLTATMRDMDHVARIDGDTFALLLPGAVLAEVAAVAERLRHAISCCEITLGGRKRHFTVSVGVAESQQGDDCETLLERTHAALAAAVHNGRNRSYEHTGQDYQPVDVEAAAI